MSMIYDNWEKLVAAVLKKELLWQLFHDHSRTPSDLSESSNDSFSIQSCLLQEAFAKLIPKLVFMSEFSPAFNVEDASLVSSELLGKGTFGSVYTAVLDNEITIVLRRIKSEIISEVDFKRNMEIVGNVRHENVVALRAYYSSSNMKLMLHDHYGGGSVSTLLHGETREPRAHVDWEIRLRIAIGAARGIAVIHAQNSGRLVHGNIKASNIFVTSQQYGCISDLGLANMVVSEYMPTAQCYAPEVKNTQNISQASDVYSFGIFLLELLTRKSPVDLYGGPQSVDLVKTITSVKSKDWAAKVLDVDLLKHPSVKEQMIKVLQIGISCVAKSPKKRPEMSKVVKMLEDINMMSIGTPIPLHGKLVFGEDNNPMFDLEDMLRSSAEVLGKGIYAISYKSGLGGNGIRIRVRRLNDVNITFKEFQQHMEVLGRTRHENVAELRAYYFSRDGKLLVCDYSFQDSVSTLLHAKMGYGSSPLNWEARLKIAVGVARGIAHIHRQDGQMLAHGNITSTNIFLNRKQYGLVSHAGLANLTGPIKYSNQYHYYAPEVKRTGKASQASDVYSFGVMLLELVTGKPSQTRRDFRSVSLVRLVQSVPRNKRIAEVLDLQLLRSGSDEEAMMQFLQIGMDCVATAPERRPKMRQVVKMLEKFVE